MAPRTANPDELIDGLAFTDSQGNRHTDITLPRRLLTTGTVRAKEAWLIADGQIADPSAPPLPSMDTPAEIQQAVVDSSALMQVERRLQALEQQPAPILPSDQALANWSMQAARVALSHSEMAALADQTVATVEGVAAAADERLGSLDAKQAALISTVSDALSEAQQATAAAVLSMEQTTAAALSDIEGQALAKAAEIARQQIGPQGLAGASTVISLEDPLEVSIDSFSARWLSRDLIDGDGVLVIRPDEILVRRWVGGAWREGPAITPKQELINSSVSAVNTGNNVYPVMAAAGGGGSGAMADPILAGSATKGAAVQIADSSRWQIGGFDAFTSGQILLEIWAVTSAGTPVGNHSFLSGSFSLLSGSPAFRYTEFAALGDLLNGSPPKVDVQLAGQLNTAAAPASIGVAVPPGTKQATSLFVTLTSTDPIITGFVLRGSVIWTGDPVSTAIPTTQTPPKRPAWQIV